MKKFNVVLISPEDPDLEVIVKSFDEKKDSVSYLAKYSKYAYKLDCILALKEG